MNKPVMAERKAKRKMYVIGAITKFSNSTIRFRLECIFSRSLNPQTGRSEGNLAITSNYDTPDALSDLNVLHCNARNSHSDLNVLIALRGISHSALRVLRTRAELKK